MSKSLSHEKSDERPYEQLVNVVHVDITRKLREQHGELLHDTFEEAMKFLSHTPSSRNLIERWWQVLNCSRWLVMITDIRVVER